MKLIRDISEFVLAFLSLDTYNMTIKLELHVSHTFALFHLVHHFPLPKKIFTMKRTELWWAPAEDVQLYAHRDRVNNIIQIVLYSMRYRERCEAWDAKRKFFQTENTHRQKKATTCKRVEFERVKMKSNRQKKNDTKNINYVEIEEWRVNVANDLINLWQCIHWNFTSESSKWLQMKLNIALGWFVGFVVS